MQSIPQFILTEIFSKRLNETHDACRSLLCISIRYISAVSIITSANYSVLILLCRFSTDKLQSKSVFLVQNKINKTIGYINILFPTSIIFIPSCNCRDLIDRESKN